LAVPPQAASVIAAVIAEAMYMPFFMATSPSKRIAAA
jgi:hypothetical protein